MLRLMEHGSGPEVGRWVVHNGLKTGVGGVAARALRHALCRRFVSRYLPSLVAATRKLPIVHVSISEGYTLRSTGNCYPTFTSRVERCGRPCDSLAV